MRNTLRVFALLDIISIFLLAPSSFQIITNLDKIPPEFLSQARVILTLALFLSLFISAIGLALFKKFGFITYYLQFPFRLVIWVFSIGFITFLTEWFKLSENWFDLLFKLCFIAEFFRLYFTVKIQRKSFS